MSETAVTLRSVADDLRAWADTLAGLDEGTSEHEQALAAMSASITSGATKVDSFAGFLRRITSEQEFIKSEEKRLKSRADALDKIDQRLREYAVRALANAGLRKIQGETSALSLRKKPDVVVVEDEASIPASYKTVEQVVKIDRRALLRDLKAGNEIPGADIKFGEDGLVLG